LSSAVARALTAVFGVLTFCGALLGPAHVAHAQTDERFAIALFGTVGLGGELHVDANYTGYLDTPNGSPWPPRPEVVSSALRPSFGGGLRLEFVPVRYFSMGAMVSLRGTQTANHVARRLNDFSVFAAARLPVSAFADGRTLTPYLLLPVGFSTGSGGVFPADRRARLGYNVGALVGAELEVQEGLSLYLEAGWQRHAIRYRDRGLRDNWRANQAVLSLGLRAAR
jgi:hypothetical protein